ncbi:hypothetical protein [Paraclostridium sordellii]|uniref:hypothetical protein n=1 Tax=Paraclostridium sordellii TaxID=1505 RepID=UPI000E546BEB|nr:hypothetical protein [Paeniclostridium sordellii]RGW96442.1 hypothetical protein DWV40_16700 [Paeniclostridium sordellii]
MVKTKILILIMSVVICFTTVSIGESKNELSLILGGRYIKPYTIKHDKRNDEYNQIKYMERFFRPSKLPILNDKIETSIYDLYGSENLNFKIPDNLLKTPKYTIINYFSVLREAANPNKDTNTGCGSLGDTKGPYPVAYNFLTKAYKQQVSYNEYLKSFENKLHTNLIKLEKVPRDLEHPKDDKYFVELEIIEGTNENRGVFGYYYGYIYVTKEDGVYKINYMQYSPENYLCAPYHGWNYDAEFVIDIKYKQWCSLVKGDIKINQDGYKKKIYFSDKNGNQYYVLFYQLTNGYDIKIADYKKDKNGNWKLIYINPEKCLEDKNK